MQQRFYLNIIDIKKPFTSENDSLK